MSTIETSVTENILLVRDKIFISLGLTMIIVTMIIFQTKITASTGLTWITFLVGLYLVLRGMKKLFYYTVSQIDDFFEPFVVYRITRWIIVKCSLIVILIVDFFGSAISGYEPDDGRDKSSPVASTNPRDGAWDVASDHFYDKNPPPPFS